MIVNIEAQHKKSKILVADDDRVQRLMLTQICEQAGHEVFLAENGEEAVHIFKNEAPDLVVLDIFMPKMDGIDAATEIQQVLGSKYVPIVFITGADNDEHLQRCIVVFSYDFVFKPFNSLVLKAKINSFLRVQQLYHMQYSQ